MKKYLKPATKILAGIASGFGGYLSKECLFYGGIGLLISESIGGIGYLCGANLIYQGIIELKDEKNDR